MTDYYKTLGVGENATPDEIKKAYRKLANQHHPDKGGDQAKFKDISVAYDNLSDPQKKAEYDHQRQYGGQPGGNPFGQEFHFHTGNGGFDPFGHMFGAGFGHPGNPFGDMFGRRRNRDLNIQCQITLIDSYLGKQLEANFQLPSGRNQTVVISIPAGIQHGETIRYQGLGDDSMQNMQRGHLNVTVHVSPDPLYERIGDDLYTNVSISPIEAMIGTKKIVNLITGQPIDLDIRAGIEPGAEFAINGKGFTNTQTGRQGRFVTRVAIKGVAVTDPSVIEELKQLDAKINNRT